MAEEELKSNNTLTQQELYSISRTIYMAAKETTDMAKLNGFKGFYDAAYIDGLLAAVQAAEDLPDEDEREDKHETLRVDMKGLLPVSLQNFQYLKRYIDKAFEKPYRKIKYDAAGGTKYEKASNENWEFVEAMNKDMVDFITANQAVLEADDNMPTTFLTKVTGDKLAFHEKYGDFKTARQTSDETQEKITANNNVYDSMVDVAKDGVTVWMDNEGKRNRYIIGKVKDIVSPPGSASLIVELQNSLFEPAVGFVIKIQAEGKPAIVGVTTIDTESRGTRAITNFPSLDPAPYTWSVYAKEGDKTPLATGKKDVNKGTNARLKITLPPIAPTD